VLERRSAAPADELFLRELYATTRPELGGWDDEASESFVGLQLRAQQRAWEERFPDSSHELILLDGRPVGRVWVAWSKLECRIVDLALLPEHRRSGIGARVVGEILGEADRRGVPTRVTVERTNGPSLAFCERFGFAAVTEDPVYLTLERPVSGGRRPRASG
jgi:GNAT superfamily N-acetyltransferase